MAKIQTDDVSSYAGMVQAKQSKTAKTAEKLAQDFEACFVTSMLKNFGKAVQTSKKNFAEDTYTAIMYETVGNFVASKKGIGIKETVLKYLERENNTKVLAEKGDNGNKDE
jgi:Rod binding domain-containing protein